LKLETDILIEAPVAVVFRFFADLDHLRWISGSYRREWCSTWSKQIQLDREYQIEVRQGRHAIALEFRTIRYELDRVFEDECLTFPVKGAIRQVTFTAERSGTRVVDMNHWDEPWYARTLVAKHVESQRDYFVERLKNAKRVVEAAFVARGDSVFSRGVATELRELEVAPVIHER
jgi:hypothetical protein